MASDRYRSLSPEAILATVRSLPRRYRAELVHDTTDPADELSAGAARSAAGFVAETAARLSALADAVHRAAVLENPTVTIAPAATGATRSVASVEDALQVLDAAVAHAADVIDALPAGAWERKATVTGVGSGATATDLTVLELAQEVARTGAEGLRDLGVLLRDA
jgi:hypothetical protein